MKRKQKQKVAVACRHRVPAAVICLLLLTTFAWAEEGGGITIPEDQPICNLYGLIKTIATIGGVLIASYAGLILTTSTEISERTKAKTMLSGVITGLIIIWISPSLVKALVGAGEICGW